MCTCICVYLCVSVYVAGADLFTEAILITEVATSGLHHRMSLGIPLVEDIGVADGILGLD